MAFNQDDLYTVSGGVTLYNYWNPFVTKHDASSFYSWEQDNLPSYDLEERTFYLWEKLGYPLSSLPGMALAVSATIPDITASSNVFTSLQDAIDALPEIIRMPTLIEVAVSGDIGTLHLDNVKCVGTGALEIINRVYAPINQSDSATSTLSYDSTSSSIASVKSTASVVRLLNTSALSLSANTSHLWPGDGVNASCGGGSFAVEYKSHGGFRGDNVSVNMHDGRDFTFRTGYALSVPDINDGGSDISDGTTDFDLSSFDGYSYQKHLRRYKATGTPPTIGVDSKVNGLISNNILRSIKVSNCDGPIYIRGFIVDGASGTNSNTLITDWGIKVNNTEGLVIEECGVARAYNGGLLVNNSNITLNRKFFAGRNYNGTTATSRYRNESCGIKALNSTINLSSDNGVYSTGKDAVFACYQHHYGIELRNSTITGGSTNTELKTCYSMSAGIRMVNSNIEMDGTLDVYSNRIGIDSKDSELTFDKFVCQYNQEAGIRARNSHIYYGKNMTAPLGSYSKEFDFDAIRYPYQCSYFGNGKHLDLVNSFYEPVKREDMEGTHRNNIFLGCNGSTSIDGVSQVGQSGVVLHNSKATFLNTLMGQGDTGSTISDVRSSNYNQSISFPTEGVLVNANSNSNVSFIGTQHFPTVLLGDRYSSNPRHSGVYATNNSNVKFSGPTAIYQFGTGVHVDSGSVLDVSPQKENGILDISSYNLIEPKNHTSFEVHSYTNCLAATNNSTIKLRDLGNANSKYPVGSFQFINSDLNDYSTSAYRHSGGCVFMPNNSENPRSPGTTSSKVNQHSAPESYKFSQDTLNGNPYNYFLGGGLILSSVISGGVDGGKSNWSVERSTGGIAVMATDNSVVDVVNVCFHTNKINKDGIYLENDELNECDHLVIWAFARGSSLHAAHLAVSGAYPSEPGYTGPTATYFSGLKYASSSVQYNLSAENNLVSGLPDTSCMSVLDFFGSGVEVQGNTFTNGLLDNGGDLLPGQDNLKLRVGWSTLRHAALGRYGCSSFENSGPFRLYFDTESHARNLVYLSGTGATLGGIPNDNRPWQTMAQGYMLSGACSSVDISNPVSIGDSYIFVKNYGGGIGVMQTSGYYHTKDAVKTDCSILLDESAANTFANAKHCSMVISERPKLVDIYKSTTTKSGDFFNSALSGAGIRTQRINDPRRTN
jgi:hypothetical protein